MKNTFRLFLSYFGILSKEVLLWSFQINTGSNFGQIHPWGTFQLVQIPPLVQPKWPNRFVNFFKQELTQRRVDYKCFSIIFQIAKAAFFRYFA